MIKCYLRDTVVKEFHATNSERFEQNRFAVGFGLEADAKLKLIPFGLGAKRVTTAPPYKLQLQRYCIFMNRQNHFRNRPKYLGLMVQICRLCAKFVTLWRERRDNKLLIRSMLINANYTDYDHGRLEAVRQFVEAEIVPCYDAFDAGHRRDHAHYVIDESLRLARYYPEADAAVVLAAAAYHDLGLCEGRETHHLASGRIVRADERLRRWFTEEEIEEIACAVEDHRASSSHAPRSLTGRLVAEADRQIDGDTIIRRTIQFSLSHYPTLDIEGHYRRVVEHLHEKYGPDGYLRLWIPESDNAVRLAEFHALLADKAAIRRAFDRHYSALVVNR